MAAVLKEVAYWEELADWLDINQDIIEENCLFSLSKTRANCYRRELIENYCNTIPSHDPYKAAEDIADKLEKYMGIRNQAQRLRELEFTSVSSELVQSYM